jgi:hypothetical protein
MKSKLMFATMIVAIMMTNGAAKAETASTKNDTSNLVKSNFEYNKLLTNGRENDFLAYQTDVLPLVADINEVRDFNNVIAQYNNNSSKFLNMATTEKQDFNQGAVVLIKVLDKIKTKQAENWLKTVKHTTNLVNLLWELNQEVKISDNIEQLPALEPEL